MNIEQIKESPVSLDSRTEFLSDLCALPSCTFNHNGINDIQLLIADFLVDLNFKTHFFRHPTDLYAPTLVGYLDVGSLVTVSLVFHVNTVIEPSKEFSFEISKVEKRVIVARHSGDVADINHMCFEHNLCVDGLGPVGGHLHTKNEYIEANTLLTRSSALTRALKS